MESPMEEIQRTMLAKSLVLAVFEGLTERESMLMIHPPPPPQVFASFEILDYIEYQKPGQYGDKQTNRMGFDMAEQSEEVQAEIKDLRPGVTVKLGWRHDYVKMSSDGGATSSSSPDRRIFLFERAPTLLLSISSKGIEDDPQKCFIVLTNMAGNEAATLSFGTTPTLREMRREASAVLNVHEKQMQFVSSQGTRLVDEDAFISFGNDTLNDTQTTTVTQLTQLTQRPSLGPQTLIQPRARAMPPDRFSDLEQMARTAPLPVPSTLPLAPAPASLASQSFVVQPAALSPRIDHSQGKWFDPGEPLPAGYVATSHPEGRRLPTKGDNLSLKASESFSLFGGNGHTPGAPQELAKSQPIKKKSGKVKRKFCC